METTLFLSAWGIDTPKTIRQSIDALMDRYSLGLVNSIMPTLRFHAGIVQCFSIEVYDALAAKKLVGSLAADFGYASSVRCHDTIFSVGKIDNKQVTETVLINPVIISPNAYSFTRI